MIWDKFIELEESMSIMMEGYCGFPSTSSEDLPTSHPNHTNKFYRSDKVDLAHISVIDMRKEKKMWMMHVACFSKPEYQMPIYGFDVIVGAKKVTGCFHDMSPTSSLPSKASKEFANLVEHYIPKRERELPPWAKEIFSGSMVVAGATKEPREIDQLCYMGQENLFSWFLDNTTVERNTSPDDIETYNSALTKYCDNQLKNTNSKNVMISLGLDEDYVNRFKRAQFPY